MKNDMYLKQASLILRVLPYIYKENCFALKGGTAINFFLQDFPRLSVDIDLAYLIISDRSSGLNEIDSSLNNISKKLIDSFNDIEIIPRKLKETGTTIGLSLRLQNISINIEVNTVFRGAVFDPQIVQVSKNVRTNFKIDLDMRLLSTEDIYGSKICAALDRQHPRDMFDIKLFLDNDGLTEDVRKAFLIYLISHPRPISELIKPHILDMKKIFDNEFIGMTEKHITYEELLSARETLIANIKSEITENEKQFLLSFKKNKTDWNLLTVGEIDGNTIDIEKIKSLPSVKWKLLNIRKMNPKMHLQAINKLEKVLYEEVL